MYKVGTKNRPICFEQVGHETTYRIVLVRVTNVCFIKIRSKLTSVLLLCLLRIFMKQTLQLSQSENKNKIGPIFTK